MRTIQIVVDEALLKATDQIVRRLRINRSALIRSALREHLRRLRTREKERQDRRGYEGRPEGPDEFGVWEKVSAWGPLPKSSSAPRTA